MITGFDFWKKTPRFKSSKSSKPSETEYSKLERSELEVLTKQLLESIESKRLDEVIVELTKDKKYSTIQVLNFNLIKGDMRHTPLSLSVMQGNRDIAELLLNHGANIDLAHYMGYSPLVWAAKLNNESMINFLLQEGADAKMKSLEGLTSAWYVSKPKLKKIIKSAESTLAARLAERDRKKEGVNLCKVIDDQIESNELIIVSLSTIVDNSILSVGKYCIVDGTYHKQGISATSEGIQCKVKLSTNKDSLVTELRLINKLMNSNKFIQVLHEEVINCREILFLNDKQPLIKCYGIIFEYWEETLRDDLLANDSSLANRMIRYILPIIEIVEELHQQGLAWLDIRPDNFLFINRSNSIRLVGCNLGSCRRLDEVLSNGYSFANWKYVPPEFARFHLYTRFNYHQYSNSVLSSPLQYDLWSLGITLLEISSNDGFDYADVNNDIQWDIANKISELTDEAINDMINQTIVDKYNFGMALRSVLTNYLLSENIQHRHYDGSLTQYLLSHYSNAETTIPIITITDKLESFGVSLAIVHNYIIILVELCNVCTTSIISTLKILKIEPLSMDCSIVEVQDYLNKHLLAINELWGHILTMNFDSSSLVKLIIQQHKRFRIQFEKWSVFSLAKLQLDYNQFKELKHRINEYIVENMICRQSVECFIQLNNLNRFSSGGERIPVSLRCDLQRLSWIFDILRSFLKRADARNHIVNACNDIDVLTVTSFNYNLLKCLNLALCAFTNSPKHWTKNCYVLVDKLAESIQIQSEVFTDKQQESLRLIANMQMKNDERHLLLMIRIDHLEVSLSSLNVTIESSLRSVSRAMQSLEIDKIQKHSELLTTLSNLYVVIVDDISSVDQLTHSISELFQHITVYYHQAEELSRQNKNVVDALVNMYNAIQVEIVKLSTAFGADFGFNQHEITKVTELYSSSMKSLKNSIFRITIESEEVIEQLIEFSRKQDVLFCYLTLKFDINVNLIRRVYYLLDIMSSSVTSEFTSIESIQNVIQFLMQDLSSSATNNKELELINIFLSMLKICQRQSVLSASKRTELIHNLSFDTGALFPPFDDLNIDVAVNYLQFTVVSGLWSMFTITQHIEPLYLQFESLLRQSILCDTLDLTVSPSAHEIILLTTTFLTPIVQCIDALLNTAVNLNYTVTRVRILFHKQYILSVMQQYEKSVLSTKNFGSIQGKLLELGRNLNCAKEKILLLQSSISKFHVCIDSFSSVATSSALQGYNQEAGVSVIELFFDKIHNGELDNLRGLLVQNQNHDGYAELKELLEIVVDIATVYPIGVTIARDFLNTLKHNYIRYESHCDITSIIGELSCVVPKFAIILPVIENHGISSDVVNLFFICPVTFQLGLPYRLTQPSFWLSQIAPMLKWSIIVMKIVLKVMNIPIILPSGINNVNDFVTSIEAMYDKFVLPSALLNHQAKITVDHIDNLTNNLRDVNSVDSESMLLVHNRSLLTAIDQLTSESYHNIYLMLKSLEFANESEQNLNWRPRYTGLTLVTSDHGTADWVLNTKEIIFKYTNEGVSALQIREIEEE